MSCWEMGHLLEIIRAFGDHLLLGWKILRSPGQLRMDEACPAEGKEGQQPPSLSAGPSEARTRGPNGLLTLRSRGPGPRVPPRHTAVWSEGSPPTVQGYLSHS